MYKISIISYKLILLNLQLTSFFFFFRIFLFFFSPLSFFLFFSFLLIFSSSFRFLFFLPFCVIKIFLKLSNQKFLSYPKSIKICKDGYKNLIILIIIRFYGLQKHLLTFLKFFYLNHRIFICLFLFICNRTLLLFFRFL